MKYRLAWNLLLLFNGFLMPQATLAQEDPWNLSFEKYNQRQQQFSPWYKTQFDDRRYTITPDSSTAQEGR